MIWSFRSFYSERIKKKRNIFRLFHSSNFFLQFIGNVQSIIITRFGMFSNDNSFYSSSSHQQQHGQQPFTRSYIANTVEELKFGSKKFIENCRRSRKLVLLVVFIALFFDNMLLTTIGKLLSEGRPPCRLQAPNH